MFTFGERAFLLLGTIGVFGFLGISFFVAGGFWGSVGRGDRRGFRKYLTLTSLN